MPFFDNRNFLEKRYLSNTDIDVNAMMSSVTGETVNGTFINLEKERSDAEYSIAPKQCWQGAGFHWKALVYPSDSLSFI